jgi:prepilin peptidase CpaA
LFERIAIVHVVVLAIALCACVTDLRSRRIPNLLTFGGALAGVLFHGITGSTHGLLTSTAGWVVGLIVFLLPFVLGGLGAGDVKLVAALGAWLGPRDVVWLALYAGVAGGVAALAIGLLHSYLSQAFRNIYLLLMHWRVVGLRPLHEVSLAGSRGPRLAYAVPVLAGLIATIWLR